jgi:CRISPR/Cas system CSM-associated protein Csm2 small subunit
MNISFYIHEKLVAAGIPIYGVAYAPLEIQFKEEAAPEQRELAQQIAEQAIDDYPKIELADKAKSLANARIEQFYALYRQINISRLAQGYTQADLNTMSVFIDAVRDRCHQYEAEIQAGQTPVIDYTDITPV